MDDAESRDLVALAEHAIDAMGRPLPEPDDHPAGEVGGVRDGHSPLHRIDVVGVACQWDATRLTDVLGDALMIGVNMGQREEREVAALELFEDPTPIPASSRV